MVIDNEFWFFLALAGGAGAFGGLLNGIVLAEKQLHLPKRMGPNAQGRKFFDLGFIADFLIGGGAALAVLVLLMGSLALDDTPKIYLIVSSISVIAGFGGINILKGLSEKLRDQLVKNFENRFEQFGKQAEAESYYHDGYAEYLKGNYDLALEKTQKAMDNNPQAPHFCLLAARISKEKQNTDQALKYFDRAIEIESSRGRRYTRALYERAALKASLQRPLEEILPDLKSAFFEKPSLAMDAERLAEFSGLKAESKFQALIGQFKAKSPS